MAANRNRTVIPASVLTIVGVLASLSPVLSSLSCAQESSHATDDESALSYVDPAAVSSLSSEELVAKALKVIAPSEKNYGYVKRTIVLAEAVLQNSRQFSDDDSPREHPFNPDQDYSSSVGRARRRLELQQSIIEQHQRALQSIQRERDQLVQFLERLDSAHQDAQAVLNAYDSVETYLLAIQLRVKDGLLAQKDIDEGLSPDLISRRKRDLARDQEEFQRKKETTQGVISDIELRVKEAQDVVHMAQTAYRAAERNFVYAKKRQELTDEYSDLKQEELLNRLGQLEEQKSFLMQAHSRSLTRYAELKSDIRKLQDDVARANRIMPGIDIQHPRPARPDAWGHKSVAAEIDFYTEQLRLLDELQKSEEAIEERSLALEGDARSLIDTVFRLEVIRATLGNAAPATADTDDEKTTVIAGQVDSTISRIQREVRLSQDRTQEVTGIAGEAQTAVQRLKDRLKTLERTQQAEQQSREWTAKVRKLDEAELFRVYESSGADLLDQRGQLDAVRQTYEHSTSEVTAVYQQLQALREPILTSDDGELESVRKQIADRLYTLAELEEDQRIRNRTFEGGAVPEAATELRKTERETPLDDYHNLLTTRLRVREDRISTRQRLQTLLESQLKALDVLQDSITETRLQALNRYSAASELHKRIAAGQIQEKKTPEDLDEALQQDFLLQLESETIGLSRVAADLRSRVSEATEPAPSETLIQRLTEFRQRLRRQGRAVKTEASGPGQDDQVRMSDPRETFARAENLVARRIDLIRAILDDEDTYATIPDGMTDLERKTLQQKANRKAAEDESLLSMLLGVDVSDESKNLTELIEGYYFELAEIEEKREILSDHEERGQRLTELATEEKSQLENIIPVLKEETELLQLENMRADALVEMMFVPEESDNIIRTYEARTGDRINRPTVVSDEDRPYAIEREIELAFDRHVQLVTAQRWLKKCQERVSVSGIDLELAGYQENLGVYDARRDALTRREGAVGGFSQQQLDALDPIDRPKTDEDRFEYLNGEIGILRADRTALRNANTSRVLVQLSLALGVALAAGFLLWLVTGFVRKRIESLQVKFLIAVVWGFGRVAIAICWFLASAHILGFDVAAILAGLGIGGLAIGLASQETIRNLISGIILFIEQPFKIGDVIEVDGKQGKVAGMTWRTTHIAQPFDVNLNIPNSRMVSANVVNYTRNYDGPVGGDYVTLYMPTDVDPDRIINLCNQALDDCSKILRKDGFRGTMLGGIVKMERRTVLQFWPWFYLPDFNSKSGVREEVWMNIHKQLSSAGIDMGVDL